MSLKPGPTTTVSLHAALVFQRQSIIETKTASCNRPGETSNRRPRLKKQKTTEKKNSVERGTVEATRCHLNLRKNDPLEHVTKRMKEMEVIL